MRKPSPSSMRGSGSVRFLDLFSDNIRAHGVRWTCERMRLGGMPEWELDAWLLCHVRAVRRASEGVAGAVLARMRVSPGRVVVKTP